MAENPGEYNKLITIQQRVAGKTPAGAPLNSWEDVVKLWSKGRGETGMATIRRDADHLGVMTVGTRYSWRIRYRPSGVNNGMRVLYKGAVYDILRVQHDMTNNEWTDLVCEAGVNGG